MLTHDLKPVMNIFPEWKTKKASFVCFGLSLNCKYSTSYNLLLLHHPCCQSSPTFKKNYRYPLYRTFPEEKEKPDLAADKQSFSEGSCHIVKVPELKQQLIIFTVRFPYPGSFRSFCEHQRKFEEEGTEEGNSLKFHVSQTQWPKDYPEWRWLFNDLGEEAGRLDWSRQILLQ